VDEGEARFRGQHRKAGLLQPGVVIGVQIVQAHDRVAVVEQALGQVKPDEAGGSRNKNFHF
jgi:hypothetical protein